MKKRRNALPQTPVTAEVLKFSHDGRGIARIDGKATFIQNALPDESVVFQYTRRKSDFDEGRVVEIIKSSPHRVEPRCPHYEICGGCSLQHLDGSSQIKEKEALLIELLARIGKCQPMNILPPLTAELWNYRNKARLSVRYVEKKQATLIGFREKNNPRYIADIHQCPVLHALIDENIPKLRQMLDSFETRESIAQIEVAAGDEDVALIFRHLKPLSANDEALLKNMADTLQVRVYLQPGGADSVHLFYPPNANELLTYTLPSEGITFQFHPNDFTQVNAGLNRLMVKQALQLLDLQRDDVVLDLFCGLGNFSLPIAKRVKKVIGIEGSASMVSRATMNAELNGICNAEFYAQNLEDDTALVPFTKQGISKVLIDPPRTGALAIVKNINLLYPKRLVYVSCNPATFARDADILVNQHGYQLSHAGVMDMFPHTAHVESIGLFEK